MKIKVMKPVEVEIKYVKISVPVHPGYDDVPERFLNEHKVFSLKIDVDSRKVCNWPEGQEAIDIFIKACDRGTYSLLDSENATVAMMIGQYVPDCIPGKYGDYIDLKIDSNGVIKNWLRNPDFSEFFEAV